MRVFFFTPNGHYKDKIEIQTPYDDDAGDIAEGMYIIIEINGKREKYVVSAIRRILIQSGGSVDLVKEVDLI